MRKLLGTVVLSAVLVGALGATVQARAVVSPAKPWESKGIQEAIAARGTIKAIVGLRTPFAFDRTLGRTGVIAQRAAIARDQAAFAAEVRGHAVHVRRLFKTIPFLAVKIDRTGLDALRRSPLVKTIEQDRPSAPHLATSTPQVEADQMWQAGYDGAGHTIAILDTGVDRNHPMLAGKVVYEACYTDDSCPNGDDEQFGTGAAAPCMYAPTQCQHGTHVAGIAAGNGTPSGFAAPLKGVAPGANIIAIQVFSQYTGSDCTDIGKPSPCGLSDVGDQVAALEKVLALQSSYSIPAANMSLGGGQYSGYCNNDEPSRATAMGNLAHPTRVVVSSGNDGYRSSMSTPACISYATSVASVDANDQIASSSNISTVTSLMAPGNAVVSSVPGTGVASKGGTSMAAPHVAGAMAVLKPFYPGTYDDNDLADRLKATGAQISDNRPAIAMGGWSCCAGWITKPRLSMFQASDLPSFELTTIIYPANENGGHATVSIKREGNLNVSSKVWAATSDNTAIAGQDYTAKAGWAPFAPGEQVKSFTIPITDDNAFEGNQSFLVTLSNPKNSNLGAVQQAAVTIKENDIGLKFSSVAYTKSEDGLTATITVQRVGGTTQPVSVNYATSNGTAAWGDYSSANGTLNFGQWETTKTFQVPIADDNIPEGDETVNLTLSSPGGGAVLSSPSTATLVIVEDDAGVMFEKSTYGQLENGGWMTTTVKRVGPLGGTLSVGYTTADGSGKAGVDYVAKSGTLTFDPQVTKKTISVLTLDNEVVQSNRSFQIKLTARAASLLGSPSTTTLSVWENDAALKFINTPSSVKENAGNATFTVQRVGYTVPYVTVNYATQAGTAQSGVDYANTTGSVTFQAGQTQKTISVPLLNDSLGEGTEQFELVLSNATSDAQIATPSATLKIAEDDLAVLFSAVSYSVGEAGPVATIQVDRVGNGAVAVGVSYASQDGSAHAPDDYAAVTGTLSFAPWEWSKTFTVPVSPDALLEGDETVLLSLSNPTGGAILGIRPQATLTIDE